MFSVGFPYLFRKPRKGRFEVSAGFRGEGGERIANEGL